MQVHLGSLSQWHLHLVWGISPKENPAIERVTMERSRRIFFMGRVEGFPLYIPARLGQNPGHPRRSSPGKPWWAGQSGWVSRRAGLFCVVFPPGGTKWYKVVQSGREWDKVGGSGGNRGEAKVHRDHPGWSFGVRAPLGFPTRSTSIHYPDLHARPKNTTLLPYYVWACPPCRLAVGKAER